MERALQAVGAEGEVEEEAEEGAGEHDRVGAEHGELHGIWSDEAGRQRRRGGGMGEDVDDSRGERKRGGEGDSAPGWVNSGRDGVGGGAGHRRSGPRPPPPTIWPLLRPSPARPPAAASPHPTLVNRKREKERGRLKKLIVCSIGLGLRFTLRWKKYTKENAGEAEHEHHAGGRSWRSSCGCLYMNLVRVKMENGDEKLEIDAV
ncbi:hypothetical protein [Oryza sativa Japonica Group]|uniref:Uncharacterized protein n=1 Tax=Oryza sativa subsp. japonica TaxID=39947 RepID=Q5ZCM5_ORYSJ|nr:hypothetical protein [Oryza sativa Japonica Group]